MGGRAALVADLTSVAVVCVLVGTFAMALAPVRVDGASMAPALQPGDLALVRRGAAPRVGDVVMFRLDGDARPTIHRVRRLTGGGLVTCGDANPIADRRAVPRERVVGRVVLVVPMSVPSDWVRERMGRPGLHGRSSVRHAAR